MYYITGFFLRMWKSQVRIIRSAMDNTTDDIIFSRLKKVLVETFRVEENEIDFSTNYRVDLGLKSTDMVAFILDLEEEFKEIIPDEDLEKLETVGDTVEYIRRKLFENEG